MTAIVSDMSADGSSIKKTPTPDWHHSSVDFIDEVQLDFTWSSEVFNTIEPESSNPVFTDFSSWGSVALESI